jgi:hypothetical protein
MGNGDRPSQQAELESLLREYPHIFGISLILGVHSAIEEVADYRAPQAEDRPFVEFIEWINERPAFIREWRQDQDMERKLYSRFVQGLEACRAGYAASHYHFMRVQEIDDAIDSTLCELDISKLLPPNQTIAIGGTQRFDFEYQAFVMAYRRSLDGLSWGLSTYFNSSISSFNDLAKKVHKLHPQPIAETVSACIATHLPNFDFVIGSEKGRSVRDRIAHRESVQAGCINITAHGYAIVGGGENLGTNRPLVRLTDVLRSRLDHLQTYITDILVQFRASVEAYENTQNQTHGPASRSSPVTPS